MYLVGILTLLFLSAGCSATKQVRQAERTLKGEWILNDIAYSEIGTFEVTLFNDATAACMQGSIWKFVPNNNTGNYTVDSAECTSTGARNFRWTIPVADSAGNYSFLFKPVDEKFKSTNGDKGFRVDFLTLDENSMTWQQTVSLEGKPFKITMKFNKYVPIN